MKLTREHKTLAAAFVGGALAGYLIGRASSSPTLAGIAGALQQGFVVGQQGASVPLDDVIANLARIGARHVLGGP